MLQQDTADDYVLATGKTHTIREFCELTFAELGIELEWQGEGENEKGIIARIENENISKLLEDNKHPIIQPVPRNASDSFIPAGSSNPKQSFIFEF